MAGPESSTFGERRSRVVVLLGFWVLAVFLEAVRVLVTSRTAEDSIRETQGSGTPDIHGPSSMLTQIRPLLILGLLLVAVAWRSAFGGRGLYRQPTVLVAAPLLFVTAFVALWFCDAPVHEGWWAVPDSGSGLMSATALHRLTQDQWATGSIVLFAAAAGIVLWIIAFRQRAEVVVVDSRTESLLPG